MRILIAALGLAMLAGCASMNERRAEGPARSLPVNEMWQQLLSAYFCLAEPVTRWRPL